MNPRDRSNALAFLDQLVSPGGFKFRPFSYGTINNMRLLGMALGRGKAAVEALTGQQKADQIHAFLFIQAAPLPVVSAAVRKHSGYLGEEGATAESAFEKFMIEHVEPWLSEIPPEGIAAASTQLEQLGELAAAVVEAKPEQGQKKSGDPSPK
jgi:hypothetical protein